MYLASVMPFETKKLNYLEILNEACILGASYHLLVFTDFVPSDDLQYMSGWSLISLTLINMLVNIVIIARESLISLKRNLILFKRKAVNFYRKYILPLFVKKDTKVQKMNETVSKANLI